jgi:hypothetical protein
MLDDVNSIGAKVAPSVATSPLSRRVPLVDPQASAAGNAGARLISPTPATAASFVTGFDETTGKSVQKFMARLCPVKISTATAGSGTAIEIDVGESADRDLASTKTVTAISPESDSAQKKASAHAPDLLNRTSCGGPDCDVVVLGDTPVVSGSEISSTSETPEGVAELVGGDSVTPLLHPLTKMSAAQTRVAGEFIDEVARRDRIDRGRGHAHAVPHASPRRLRTERSASQNVRRRQQRISSH